jgi:hypothetical protein
VAQRLWHSAEVGTALSLPENPDELITEHARVLD